MNLHFQLPHWLARVDHAMLWALPGLAIAILISGLDDLLVDLVWFGAWIKRRLRPRASLFPPGARQLDSAPRRSIAIIVPSWHEHEVIAQMLEHSISAIEYSDYHIFAGTYPNDEPTQRAVLSVANRFPNVHLVVCPHDGPTSKADCLNAICQHLLHYEQQETGRFEIIVIHDAEDLIHPDELRWINFYSARYDFVQTPVLALATPFKAFTHGVYCDEFAEYHTRDMTVRPLLGGFLPSCGVGTGYRREALEKVALTTGGVIFEPSSLTEDYENGLRLFRCGCSQEFVPISRADGRRNFMATREYFPQNWGSALRQRTRWVMGIALQGWQSFGWAGKPGELYWLWRDRKGLVANPLGLAANVLFLYGIATAMWTRVTPFGARVAAVTLALQILRTSVRTACVTRIYGFGFALGVPLRTVYANVLNTAATFHALVRFGIARAHNGPLKWAKTDHAFPQKRRLGEILVSSGYLTAPALHAALATQTSGVRLGEHLVRSGNLDEDAVYDALGLQHGLPVRDLAPREIPRRVAHAIPEQVIRQWRVLPFQIADGALFVASPDVPSEETTAALRSFTALEIRFHLVTPEKFERLTAALL